MERSKFSKRRRACALALVSSAAVAAMAGRIHADDLLWSATSDSQRDWKDPVWATTGGPPTIGDTAIVQYREFSPLVTGTNNVALNVFVASSSTNAANIGRIDFATDSALRTSDVMEVGTSILGYAGDGLISQANASTATFPLLRIGNQGYSGTYVLGAGATLIIPAGGGTSFNGLNVGSGGLGVMSSSGTLTVGDRIELGAGDSFHNASAGTFYQTGGSVTAHGMEIGHNDTGAGSLYQMSAGTLTNHTDVLDIANNSAFVQTGGSVFATDSFASIPDVNVDNGSSYSLSGDGLLSTRTVSLSGTFNQSGGSNTLGDVLTINAGGTYNMSAGALSATNGISNSGTFNLSGGTLATPVFFNTGALNVTGSISSTLATLTGTGTLTVGNGTAAASFTVASGTQNAIVVMNNGALTFDNPGAGSWSGSYTTNSATNNGSLTVGRGTASLGTLTGPAGTLTVGGSSGTALATVTKFDQGAIVIGGGGTLRVAAGTPTVTNTAGSLTISGSGTLDLTNHYLLVNATNTAASTIHSYLQAGYAGGSWNGTGSISSSTVASGNSGIVKKYALGYAAAGQLNVVPTIPANSILVRPTMFGDTNLDGTVNNADISAIIAGGKYLDGTTNNSWAVGDWNYDGKVDNNDISNLIASGNYLSGESYGNPSSGPTPSARAAAGAASHGSARLTSSGVAARPAVTTIGSTGDGVPDFVYDASTGDVVFAKDGLSGTVQELHLLSASSQLVPANLADPNVGLNGVDVLDAGEIDLFRQGTRLGVTNQFADGYDLGAILPTGLTSSELTDDLTAAYTLLGGGAGNVTSDVLLSGSPGPSAGVPEPASVAAAGVAIVGLLGRRRRRR